MNNNLLKKLKDYKEKTGCTIENLAHEVGVTFGTMQRYLSKPETKLSRIYHNAIKTFLTSKGIKLSLLLAVSWQLDFRPFSGEVKTVEMFKEFQSFKQIEMFIRNAPHNGEVWECKHENVSGYCQVYDFGIVNTDGKGEQNEDK